MHTQMIPWNKGLTKDKDPRIATPWLGKKRSQELKDKIRATHIRNGHMPPIDIRATGENHPLWKGDKVGYRSLHKWVERHLGKASQCMNDISHIATRYQWANISKEYKRDLSDWLQLCPSCNGKDRIGRRVSP